MLRTDATFNHLPAAIIADAFRLYNAFFFGHAITAVFEYHTRLLHLQTTNDSAVLSPTAYRRHAIHHFIEINQAYLINRPYGPEIFALNANLSTI